MPFQSPSIRTLLGWLGCCYWGLLRIFCSARLHSICLSSSRLELTVLGQTPARLPPCLSWSSQVSLLRCRSRSALPTECRGPTATPVHLPLTREAVVFAQLNHFEPCLDNIHWKLYPHLEEAEFGLVAWSWMSYQSCHGSAAPFLDSIFYRPCKRPSGQPILTQTAPLTLSILNCATFGRTDEALMHP